MKATYNFGSVYNKCVKGVTSLDQRGNGLYKPNKTSVI